ncbi:hypothetical protein IOD14_01085 [Streptomyces sp. A2-16]|uniref:hypothetical protein n=1 Tax=Streptomyces sp. A2-16 TaxID=2781734 RepID=UPI000F4FB61C|nr:hypothetical protein [Streptomyces sp. A2-16]QUC55498.1 hypothetical protein IOD14_01085 [Streptomyces sp. A2-16]
MTTARKPEGDAAPDTRDAVRHHYGVVVKRFLLYFPVFLVLWGQIFVTQIGYLLPVAVIGMVGVLWTLFLFAGRLQLVRKCSRVFRTYPLAFRAPVEKIGREGGSTLYLRLGDQAGSPFTQRARTVIRGGWPPAITDGVWFAGDEPFGGAILVPGSGELLFLQPRDWAARDEDRSGAGPERIEKAGRAGIGRPARSR